MLPDFPFSLLSLKPSRVWEIDPPYPSLLELSDGEINGGVDSCDPLFRINGKCRDVEPCMELLLQVLDNGLIDSSGLQSIFPVFLSFGLPTWVIIMGLPPLSTIWKRVPRVRSIL